ncbi:AI-2E family transporter [Clostridium magnum]|uniref:AI-2 transport protein TqsA n=1 Tax=Clostridium magnum DSM 2767 TaxID=1121326 RepID=A0A161XAH0_9CLOT|nr:AI-2E family transporter [Clostridium magnum]KZL91256.1 AI-2 transport protein TqsA [Clostridium magnum DSM 2767]SHI34706.1 Predicted PurR-regulated permease PerM [Clostridium magnum DSM 2767]
MFFNKEKIKYFDLIVAVILSFIIIQALLNYKSIFLLVGKAVNILYPFILAFIIAYVLNPVMNFLENKLKLKRGQSILITYACIVTIIVAFSMLLLPKIFNNVIEIAQSIPLFTTEMYKWMNSHNVGMLLNSEEFIRNNVGGLVQKFSVLTSNWLNIILSTTISFTSSLINILFGLIISIYILFDKEKFKDFSIKLTYITFQEKWANRIIELIRNIDKMISLYIGTKAVDSLIIGAIALVALILFKSPYAMLIAIIVTITNMIPYFGPFLGMIPPFLINFFYDPKRALWILLFLILLQQFDAWFLEPKLVGDKVGLSPFLLILGITIGGTLFGIWGMLLASPITAVIKIYMERWFEYKIRKC